MTLFGREGRYDTSVPREEPGEKKKKIKENQRNALQNRRDKTGTNDYPGAQNQSALGAAGLQATGLCKPHASPADDA